MTSQVKQTSEVRLARSPDHKSHYIIGAVPQWTRDDLRLHLYNEVIEEEGGSIFVTTTQLIIPRTALPRILEVLKTAARNDSKVVVPEAKIFSDLTAAIDGSIQERKAAKKKVQKIRRK